MQPGMDVQRTTTRTTLTGKGVRRAHEANQFGSVLVCWPLPGVHHTAGEQPDIGVPCCGSRLDRCRPPQRQPTKPELERYETQPLCQCQHRRTGKQGPVMSKHGEPDALPPRRDLSVAGECCPRALHQRTELHATWARRFATTTLHARFHEVDKLLIDRKCTALDCAHCVDAPTWRIGLLTGYSKRRTVREAEPTAHTLGQSLRIEIQRRHRDRPNRREAMALIPQSSYAPEVPDTDTSRASPEVSGS